MSNSVPDCAPFRPHVDNHHIGFKLQPDSPVYLANIQGYLNEHLKLIEKRLHVYISNRGNRFTIKGTQAPTAKQVVWQLYEEAKKSHKITPELVHLVLVETKSLIANKNNHLQASNNILQKIPTSASNTTPALVQTIKSLEEPIIMSTDHPLSSSQLSSGTIQTKRLLIKPRSVTQLNYITSIREKDINFGIGPAGTGKTYLAVACAVEALEQEQVRRVLLVRPAVEAGEKLGFLPGDLSQKIDPYLRPLYDALYEMLGFDVVERLISKNLIEVAPLAYMRGRTLNNSFIILDESQNTTKEQMKMFLTRIGFGSTAVITGDITQVDLPKGTDSGLKHAMEVLQGVLEIGTSFFSSIDVIRHPIVQKVVEAYNTYDQQHTYK